MKEAREVHNVFVVVVVEEHLPVTIIYALITFFPQASFWLRDL